MILSIIILNYRTKGLTKYCARGILRLGLSFPYEIIIVDNASGDGSVEYLTEAFEHEPIVRILALSLNRGYAAGNNAGIRAARGAYTLILNPDILVLPGAIESLLQAAERDERIGVVGPQLLNPDRSIQYSCYRFPVALMPLYRRTVLGKLSFGRRALEQYAMHDWDHQSSRDVHWLLGAALLFSRSALERIGHMDEQFFLYFEDIDWCRRAHARGFSVRYHPDAKMIHYHQRDSAAGGILRLLTHVPTRAHLASWVKYMWKYRGTKTMKHKNNETQKQ